MPRKIVQERQAAVASVVKLHNDHAEEVDWLPRKEARSWFQENFRDVIVPFAKDYAYEDLGKVEHRELHTDVSNFE